MRKLRAGIPGATGNAGQRLIQLLDRHPWFEVSFVAASDNLAGKNYAQATRWMLDTPKLRNSGADASPKGRSGQKNSGVQGGRPQP